SHPGTPSPPPGCPRPSAGTRPASAGWPRLPTRAPPCGCNPSPAMEDVASQEKEKPNTNGTCSALSKQGKLAVVPVLAATTRWCSSRKRVGHSSTLERNASSSARRKILQFEGLARTQPVILYDQKALRSADCRMQ